MAEFTFADVKNILVNRIGLPEDAFVFCCFNSTYKFSPTIFKVWMRLLQSIDGSVLWLTVADDVTRENLLREAERRGTQSGRLVLTPKVGHAEYLARHKLADLFLDTLPYTAHATGSNALAAGLPILTCRGATFAGRVGSSMLHAAGLPELVACSRRIAFSRSRTSSVTSSLRTKRGSVAQICMARSWASS